MRQFRDDPREIKAKFDGICHESGKKINRGDRCIFYPRSKAIFHKDSNQAQEYYRWWHDTCVLSCN